MAATIAVAVSGPMPGTPTSRRQASLARACARKRRFSSAIPQNVDGLPIEQLVDHLDSMSQMSGLNFSAFGITV